MGYFETDDFPAPKTLIDRFGKLSVLKHFLGIDETAPLLGPSFKVSTKLKSKLQTDKDLETIALMKLSSLG